MVQLAKEAAELICGAARNLAPNEFGAFLRKNKEGIISEVLIVAQTVWGKGFASFHLNNLPLYSNTCGSVHSHPSYSARPSQGDLLFFSRRGGIHLIVKAPFGLEDIVAYDEKGRKLDLEIV